MRPVLLLSALALLGTALAGCAADPRDGADAPAPSGNLPVDLAAQLPPAPAWDAKAGLDWWEAFVTGNTLRMAYTPQEQDATDAIAASMRALGFDVEVLDYGACVPLTGACAPGQPPAAPLHVVAALKRGASDPDHAIALGAHYDNVYPPVAAVGLVGGDVSLGTIEAAYDNGSGTAMVYNVCKQLVQVELRKSLLCLFFSGEEEGAQGSAAYVADPPAGHPAIDAYLGYDMVGINWPGPVWKLYNWVADEFAADLHPFVNATVTQVLGWPVDGAEVFPFNDRNSDEASFIGAHIPAIRFAGGRTASDYPAYHSLNDTVEFVDAFVGGRDNFALGFGAIVEESVLLARMLDRTSMDEVRAWAEA